MRKVIMTYIVGDYDTLKDPTVVTPGWDYISLSDEGIGSDVWRPVPLAGRPQGVDCPKRRTSLIKILQHDYVDDDCEVCITVDGSMQVNCDLDAFLDEFWPPGTLFTLAKHPKRTCLYDEAAAVVDMRFDDPAVVEAQVARYRAAGFPAAYGLYGTRLMVKDNRSPRLRSVCERWADEYRAGSRRDQLSLTYALWCDAQEHGELPMRSFDFDVVFRSRELFSIGRHLRRDRWQ
jgi:hypothetical protein